MLQRISQLQVTTVKYALNDVFVIGHVHAEKIPLFWRCEALLCLIGLLVRPYNNNY